MEYFIKSSGFKIFTRTEGNGRPVLLLHSLWGSQLLFDSLSVYLSQKYTIVRIDFPGHGKSPSPGKNYTFEEFAPVLNDVLNQIGIEEKIHLIGHSMGGFAALAFARMYEEKVASLSLAHTLIHSPDQKSINNRNRQADLIRRQRRQLLLQLANESNFAPGNAKKFPFHFTQLTKFSNEVTDEGALAAIHAINTRQNSMEFLMKAKFPILIVIGKKDRVYNPNDQLREQKSIPGAEVLLLNESGHLGFLEEEEFFNSRVEEFLERIIL